MLVSLVMTYLDDQTSSFGPSAITDEYNQSLANNPVIELLLARMAYQ